MFESSALILTLLVSCVQNKNHTSMYTISMVILAFFRRDHLIHPCNAKSMTQWGSFGYIGINGPVAPSRRTLLSCLQAVPKLKHERTFYHV